MVTGSVIPTKPSRMGTAGLIGTSGDRQEGAERARPPDRPEGEIPERPCQTLCWHGRRGRAGPHRALMHRARLSPQVVPKKQPRAHECSCTKPTGAMVDKPATFKAIPFRCPKQRAAARTPLRAVSARSKPRRPNTKTWHKPEELAQALACMRRGMAVLSVASPRRS